MFTHSRQGAVDIITGNTPLNVEMCSHMLNLVEDCLGHGQPRIILDLRQVSYIDSAGLEALLDIRDRCDEAGGCCKICSPNHLCQDILTATGLDHEFEILDDVIQGAGSFTK